LVYAFDRSNSSPSQPTTIVFQIPKSDAGFDGKVFTIKLTSGLFAPGANTTIDGSSQRAFTGDTNPAGPEIVINGSGMLAGTQTPGLSLTESNCVVRELVINGCIQQGIRVAGSGASGNMVTGCYIGTDATGTQAVPNNVGIEASAGARVNTVGGTNAGDRNVIAGNSGAGVLISGLGSDANAIAGNLIGLTAGGANALGNGSAGVQIAAGAKNNTIGGTDQGSRNFISGNAGDGIVITGAGTNSNVVTGNTIGANLAYAVAGNGGRGVSIADGAQANSIGAIGLNGGNLIRNNVQDGVAVINATSQRNAIYQNSTGNNGGRGIALYQSANNQQPYPILSSAVLGGAGVSIAGILNAAPNAAYRIEFHSNSVPDPTGFGEGELFIGAINVTTSSNGSANFIANLPAAVPAGYVVTSKATDSLGNTSEFSGNMTVTANDSDQDGMPDQYESTYGFNAQNASDASIDSDGDGMTNLQEFRAGTNPRDPTSVLHLSAIDFSTGAPRLSFTPVAGKNYRIEYSDRMSPATWTLLSSIFATDSNSIQITDKGASGRSQRFYRLTVQY
jgi:hypothetical protein